MTYNLITTSTLCHVATELRTLDVDAASNDNDNNQ